MPSSSAPSTSFTDIEREAIVLNAVTGIVAEMVNHGIFMPLWDKLHDTNLLPRTPESLRLFSTLLRDFLSPLTTKRSRELPFGLQRPPNGDSQSDHTTLFHLREVLANPLLGGEALESDDIRLIRNRS